MNKRYFIFLFFCSHFSFGQTNLVPNPSFEMYDTCPQYVNGINFATGWLSFRFTPDYDNTCSTSSLVSVPSNYFGYQYPASGNGYADIATYAPGLGNENVREFMGSKIIDSLIIGQKYFASVKVSAAYNAGTGMAGAGNTCFTNNIGITFSTKFISPYIVTNHAQVYSTAIINDTVNWVTITGSFIADSAYKYIVIGNFFADSNSIQVCQPNAICAYIYVDDVCVTTDSLYNETWIGTGVDIKENDIYSSLSVFPNPSSDWIEISGKGITNISLYDILGNLCFTKLVFPSETIKVDISKYSKGMYFLNAETKTKNINKILIKN